MSASSNGELKPAVHHPEPLRQCWESAGGDIGSAVIMEKFISEREVGEKGRRQLRLTQHLRQTKKT